MGWYSIVDVDVIKHYQGAQCVGRMSSLIQGASFDRRQKYDHNGDLTEIPPTNKVNSLDVVEVLEMPLMVHAFAEFGKNESLGPPAPGSLLQWHEDLARNEERL